MRLNIKWNDVVSNLTDVHYLMSLNVQQITPNDDTKNVASHTNVMTTVLAGGVLWVSDAMRREGEECCKMRLCPSGLCESS